MFICTTKHLLNIYYKYYIYNISGLMTSNGYFLNTLKFIHFIHYFGAANVKCAQTFESDLQNNNKKIKVPNVQKALDSAVRTK